MASPSFQRGFGATNANLTEKPVDGPLYGTSELKEWVLKIISDRKGFSCVTLNKIKCLLSQKTLFNYLVMF